MEANTKKITIRVKIKKINCIENITSMAEP